MSEHLMNEIDFYHLRVCWSDFFDAISSISSDRITGKELEWKTLQDSFHYQKEKVHYEQHEIVTASMASMLHKYMAIACTFHLVREIEQTCPGWPWLLMEMDAQVAKRKLGEQKASEKKRMALLLARIERLE